MLRSSLLTIVAVWGWLDLWLRGWDLLDSRHEAWWVVWYGVGALGIGGIFDALWFAPRRRRS